MPCLLQSDPCRSYLPLLSLATSGQNTHVEGHPICRGPFVTVTNRDDMAASRVTVNTIEIGMQCPCLGWLGKIKTVRSNTTCG